MIDPEMYNKVLYNNTAGLSINLIKFMLWWLLLTMCCPHQRCIYATCNCEKTEDCMCAVFSSYARACASKGVFLSDWRVNVCGKSLRTRCVVYCQSGIHNSVTTCSFT